jgi:hypothetical protein
VFPGAEKFVDLLEKLSSGPVVFVIDDNLNTISGGLDGRGQTGGSGSHAYHFRSYHGLPH